MANYRNFSFECDRSDRTDKIIEKCFYDKSKSSQRSGGFNSSQTLSQIVPQMRSESTSLSGRGFPLTQSQSLSTRVDSQSITSMTRSDVNSNSIRSQSQTKVFTNRDLIHQIVDSNRDKELIERVDQKINKFEETLNDLKELLNWEQIETIVSKSVRNELIKSNDLKEALRRAENENRCLREEVLKLRAIQTTERDITSKHIQTLNDLKQEIIDCLPNSQTINSLIDYKNDSQKHLFPLMERIEKMFKSFEQKDYINSNNYSNDDSIDWFDDI